MGELVKLFTSSGAGQVALGIALAWIILNLHLLKARAKEDREAAEKLIRELIAGVEKRAKEDRELAERRAKGDRELADKRAKEDREAADKRAKDDREAIDKRAQEDRDVVRQHNAKNAAEHAELTGAVHELKTQVKVLLDRSNRPGPPVPQLEALCLALAGRDGCMDAMRRERPASSGLGGEAPRV